MLNQTHEELINFIYTHGNASSMQLASHLKLSKRTVISYVREINDSVSGGLIRSNNRGYYLDYEALADFREAVPSLSVDDPARRDLLIARTLLHGYRDKINIFDTAASLHYSESTIRATLYKIREEAHFFGLDIQLRGNTASVTGTEHQKREYYYSLFQDSLAQNLYDFASLYEVLPQCGDDRLYEKFLSCVKNYYQRIDNYELAALYYRLILTVDRIAHAHYMETNINTDFIWKNDLKLAKELAAETERITGVHFSDIETVYLAQMFSAICMFSGSASTITLQTIEKTLWPTCSLIVQQTADGIEQIYHRNIRQSPDDYLYFALHIRSIIRRSRAAIQIMNPYLSYVWEEYSSALDCAVYTAGQILDVYPDTTICKDDIAGLALCLGNIFEQGFSDDVKIQVLFVLPSYYHVHQTLYQYYQDHFQYSTLAEHVTALSACDHLNSVDVVVSTQNLKELTGKRFLQIKPIQTQTDLRRLRDVISEVHHSKMLRNLQELLLEIQAESHFLHCPENITDMNAALDYLIQPLLERGIVSDDFKAAILRRETLACTVWEQVALPRAAEYSAAEDTVSILIFDAPFYWEGVSIRAAILFTSREGHYSTHCLKILRRLIHVLQKKGGPNKLLNCQCYEDFCSLLTR